MSEKRLIDANAFLKELNERPLDFLDVGGDFGYFDETIDSVVNEQPTVDAVEVVRCEKCKHWGYHGGYGYFCNHPKSMRFKSKKDDFCSYGERRTDNE